MRKKAARTLYARPDGGHYHTSRRCPMLGNEDFKRLGYVRITESDVKKRKLRDCACVSKLDEMLKSARLARRDPA